jgi:hypothetical protein
MATARRAPAGGAATPAPAAAGAGSDAVDIVPSGHALSVVRSWLPPMDDDDDAEYDAMQDWGDAPETEEAPRPARRVSRRRA